MAKCMNWYSLTSKKKILEIWEKTVTFTKKCFYFFHSRKHVAWTSRPGWRAAHRSVYLCLNDVAGRTYHWCSEALYELLVPGVTLLLSWQPDGKMWFSGWFKIKTFIIFSCMSNISQLRDRVNGSVKGAVKIKVSSHLPHFSHPYVYHYYGNMCRESATTQAKLLQKWSLLKLWDYGMRSLLLLILIQSA